MFNIALAKSIVALTTCLVTVYPFIGLAQHLIIHDRKFYKNVKKVLGWESDRNKESKGLL